MIPPVDKCQRWREGSSCFRPAREVVDTKCLDVAEIGRTVAKPFVELHHYARRFPGNSFRFGLYQRGELAGVAVFSKPFTVDVVANVFPGLEDPREEALELSRFVLLDDVGPNAETWFLKRCFRLLAGRARGIVSFSDPCPRTRDDGTTVFPGHVGTIYQAKGARYLDVTEARTLRILPDGTVFSNFSSGKIRRGLRGWRSSAAELERFGADPLAGVDDEDERIAWLEKWRDLLTRPMRHPGLHRYAWNLDPTAAIPHGPDRPYPKKRIAA
jgi:hypothetical protein